MVTTIEEFNKDLQDVVDELRYSVQNNQERILPDSMKVYSMDKPIHVITNNSDQLTSSLIDKGDHYEMLYPRYGSLHKTYTNDFAWVIDNKTVFCIERPFNNRVVRLLRELLPNENVESINNDLIINGYKVGPTCMAGRINDWKARFPNPQNSGCIYCLRWSDVAGLDDYFAGDPNHEKRKASDTPLGSLDMFLNISKEEFETLLEQQEVVIQEYDKEEFKNFKKLPSFEGVVQ